MTRHGGSVAKRYALPKDAHGNAHVGDVLTHNSHNTFVHASSRLVSLLVGPRQVGKTTAVRQLLAQGAWPHHYANADDVLVSDRSWPKNFARFSADPRAFLQQVAV